LSVSSMLSDYWIHECKKKKLFDFFPKKIRLFLNFLLSKISRRKNQIHPDPEFWNFPDYGSSVFSEKKPSVFTRKKSFLIRKSVKNTSLSERKKFYSFFERASKQCSQANVKLSQEIFILLVLIFPHNINLFSVITNHSLGYISSHKRTLKF